MHADEHGRVARHVAVHERQRQTVVHRRLVCDHRELAEVRRELRRRRPLHQLLLLDTVLDQVLDGDALELEGAGEGQEIRHPGHPAFVVEHLADDPRGRAAGKPRQVHRRLGVAGAPEDTAGHRAQREDVARPRQVVRARGGVDEGADGDGAVEGRRARRHAAPGVHADGEGRAERRRVVRDHHGDLQLVQALPHHRHADQAPAVLGHEVDGLRRHLVRGHQEVALVLPVLVVHHHEDATGTDLLDGLLDLHEVPLGPVAHAVDPPRVRNRCTYLPIISISRFTRRPGLSAPSVVCPSVCGISMISKARGVERGHGQAHAVHRHRPLRNEEPGQRGILPLDPEARRLSVPREGRHGADAVDVPLNEMATQEAAEPQRPLEVDSIPGAELAERGADEGLGARDRSRAGRRRARPP